MCPKGMLPILVLLLLSPGTDSSPPTCPQRCTTAGHCCTDNLSACQMPSCQMGCAFGAGTASLQECNNTCHAAKGCSFTFKDTTYSMCGDCPQRWLNPATLTPEILPGPAPFWPPGFNIGSCSSCGDMEEECVLGCRMYFDSSVNPVPPTPTPPPPTPMPAAPWPNPPTDGFNFSVALSSHMVLQQAPAAAAVFGNVGTLDPTATVAVTVTAGPSGSYTVAAAVTAGRWKALLRPTTVGNTTYMITATRSCDSGCSATAPPLVDVVFGDTWFCFGQSNMWLQLRYTYNRNQSTRAIAEGRYDNIRLMSGDSQSAGLDPSYPPTHPWRTIRDAASMSSDNTDSLDQFSAACYHYAEALTDQFRAAGKEPPTLGLVAMAIGGSMIEEWMTNDVAAACYGASADANGQGLNHVLWDVIVRPFLDMTVKGWLFYQGENNAGSLHGNAAVRAGYGCLMPALVSSIRAAWSAVPGTTDPSAPFGIVTLSSGDSEGAADIASFRWAQQANYGTVPNPALPNVFLAHAYDLADPWVNCGGAPQTKQCAGCDTVDSEVSCLTPWYMGPGIHPRLKLPVGQRLAAAALPIVYGWGGPSTGPTVAGCTATLTSLSIRFNVTLLAGAALKVGAGPSAMSVLVNGTGAPGTGTWIAVNIRADPDALGTVDADVSRLVGAVPQAVKYAWGATGGTPNDQDVVCCAAGSAPSECIPGQCPIFAESSLAPLGGFPANPFLAEIVNGKCICAPPQRCDD